MNRLTKLVGPLALAFSCGAFAAPVSWSGAGANDWTAWSGLGAEGSPIAQNFSANSAHAVAVSGSFSGASGGSLAVVGGSVLGWMPGTGFNAGDSVLWSNDGNAGTGPLGLSFAGVEAAGLFIQAAAQGAFSVNLHYVLGGGGSGDLAFNSDANGSGMFVGVDTGALSNIVGITVSLTQCASLFPGAACDLGDFGVNSLQLREAASSPTNGVPTPATLPLVLIALAGAVRRQRRSA